MPVLWVYSLKWDSRMLSLSIRGSHFSGTTPQKPFQAEIHPDPQALAPRLRPSSLALHITKPN